MTTPTGSTVDISLDPPTATFGIQLDKTDPPDKLDYPEKAKWALGLRASDPYAEFSSEAWFADTIGDEFYLYGNGKELSKGSITTKAPRYFLNVLLNNLLPTSLQEGLVDVYWEVVRKASGQRSRSTTEKYLVKKTRPAGIDRRPDIFGHDGLRVVAEGFSADADIDASTAANGMWALVDKYQNARENDEIFVYLDGIATKRRLSAAEAAGAGPYRVFIPSAVFQRISQSGTVALICTVIDVAGNIPEGNDKFSLPYLLSSNLDPSLFDPPLFYVNGLESTLLDLGTQSNLPLSVLATVRRSIAIASPPNQIVVTLTLTKADGTQTSKRLAPFSHTQRAGNQTPVPNEYFKEEGFVRMSFELFTPTGVLLGRSGSSTVRVLGTPVLTYPAPAFDNMSGPQTITLQNYLNGGAVAVTYRSMSPADVIRLIWSIPNGNVVNIAPQTGTTGGTVLFPISAQIINQSAGQLSKLSYQVTVGGKTTTSDVQEVTIVGQLKIAQEPMTLSGLSIKVPWWAKSTGLESIGNSGSRVATGGLGTLTYTSRKPSVASVNAQGLVIGNGWGSTTIDVRDQYGTMVSYPVNVSNVYRLVPSEAGTDFNVALGFINSGHRQLGWDGVADLQRVYGPRLPVNQHYWFGPTTDPSTAVFYHWQNGGIASGGRTNHVFGAWTLVQLIG
ncbi:hypothetical protein ACI77I_05085 [Pseudomonas sp. D47]|uniref:hypothetical protein n=1 Tax=Pseudomonas sp. D47 TaxID=3159447 RepID=UPI00387A92EF